MDNKTAKDDDIVGIDVILAEDGEKGPHCAHGPTLLFEKVSRGGKAGRRFYACSACRDRKDCNFFQWEGEKVSEARRLAREAENRSKRPPFSHAEFSARLRRLSPSLRRTRASVRTVSFCCCLENTRSTPPTPAGPSPPLSSGGPACCCVLWTTRRATPSSSSASAAPTSCWTAWLPWDTGSCCVWAPPRLQELIKLWNLEHPGDPVQSLLLDMDFRYAQFYSQEEFCHYNMFNHHFFDGQASRMLLQTFLMESQGRRAAMVADPPFGGLVKPLASSFSRISHTWRKMHHSGSAGADMPMVWIFPYFLEPRIQESLPSLTMLDYQVDYDNHPLYKRGAARKGSPVRIFTNLPTRDFVLPKEEGYRFCSVCQRFVWKLNKHCDRCNSCPSKDGREWKHCSSCGKCVKASWRHCTSCGRCALTSAPVWARPGTDHKRRACPRKERSRLQPDAHTSLCRRPSLKPTAPTQPGAAGTAKKRKQKRKQRCREEETREEEKNRRGNNAVEKRKQRCGEEETTLTPTLSSVCVVSSSTVSENESVSPNQNPVLLSSMKGALSLT